MILISRRAITTGMLVCLSGLAVSAQGLPLRGEWVDVLVRGKAQPVFRVAGEERLRRAFRLEQARRNIRELAGRDQRGPAFVNARAELERATVEFRRATAQRVREELRPDQDRIERLLESVGAQSLRRFWLNNSIAARVPAKQLDVLVSDPDVAAVSEVEVFRTELDISVVSMGAPLFWEYGVAGQGESIAVLDTGIRKDHPMFQGMDIVARSFTTLQNACVNDVPESPVDYDGHGSHVASTAAGRSVKEYGVSGGVAPGVDRIYALKVGVRIDYSRPGCEYAGGIASPAVYAALEYLIEETPAKIVNMSFGSSARPVESEMSTVVDLLAETFEIQFSIAAGNAGPNSRTVASPAEAFNGLAVANMDTRRSIAREDDEIAESSSRGPTLYGRRKPDIAAPGTRIFAAGIHGSITTEMTGTSMAAPHVAGAVALLRQFGLDDPLELKAVLLNSTLQDTWSGTGWLPDRGYGYINLPLAAKWSGQSFRSELVQGKATVGTRYWKGAPGENVYATAVNYRHAFSASPVLNDLDLSAWATDGNRRLAFSRESEENVQQFVVNGEREIVITVRPQASSLDVRTPVEPFALALSTEGFQPVNGPELTFACSTPSTIPAKEDFVASCVLSNSGDLPIYSVQLGQEGATPGVLVPILGAGEELKRSFRVGAIFAPGTATVTLRATAAAYGLSYSGTLSRTLTVTQPAIPLPAVAASPTALSFTSVVGQPGPAAQTVQLNGTGAGVTFAAQAQNNWVSVSVSGGTVPATLRISVNPQGLAAGTYDGSVRILLIGSSTPGFSIPVRLQVAGRAAPAMTDLRISSNTPASNCTAPAGQENFSARNASITAWALLQNIQPGDVLGIDWISPAGVTYRATPVTFRTAGSVCTWDSLPASNLQTPAYFGVWTVRTTLNGTAQPAKYFILSAVTLAQVMTTAIVPSGSGCATPTEMTTFLRTAREVSAWFLVQGAAAGDRPVVEWRSPGGAVFRTDTLAAVPSAGNWCYSTTMPIAGAPAGDWSVIGKWNGAILFGTGFRIQ